tara:strand:+ start:461 stop:1357 length:897 start_codon:yes stop_codon:yes gene_type:complete
MNVLVTGATGFLGRHLVKKLESLGYKIFISNTQIANLEDETNLNIYNDIEFEYIFHLAAYTKCHPDREADQFFKNNLINNNIIFYWKNFQPQAKFVCFGTTASYAPEVEMIESNYFLKEPEEKYRLYSLTKRNMLRSLQSLKGANLKWLYLIPSTIYGPDFDLDDDRYLYDFVRNCYKSQQTTSPFIIWGDGTQIRELIYVDDVIEKIMFTLSFDNEVINVGNGCCYSINDIAKQVCGIFKFDYSKIERDLSKNCGMKKKNISVEKLKLMSNNYEFKHTPIAEGLKKTINFFKINLTS